MSGYNRGKRGMGGTSAREEEWLHQGQEGKEEWLHKGQRERGEREKRGVVAQRAGRQQGVVIVGKKRKTSGHTRGKRGEEQGKERQDGCDIRRVVSPWTRRQRRKKTFTNFIPKKKYNMPVRQNLMSHEAV